MNFDPMPKIARLNKEVIVTEKIDGTNASVCIEIVAAEMIQVAGEFNVTPDMLAISVQDNGDHWIVRAGSKNRFLTEANDNHGFAKWVGAHAQELLELGPGVHRGEFWGKGIQRGYGLDEKRFSLFNVSRWMPYEMYGGPTDHPLPEGVEIAPACCRVVPILGKGIGFEGVEQGLALLQANGSVAAPGFMKPEGLCIFHTGDGSYFKATIENDLGKWFEKSGAISSEVLQ